MDELSKLEEKLNALILLISELKQKIEEYDDENTRLKERDKEIKQKIEGLVDRIDNLVI